MCRTFVEDRIPFRCSDTWRDHYYEQGLTPHHSPGYSRCRDRLAERQESLETTVKELVDAVSGLAEGIEVPVKRRVAALPAPAQPRKRYVDIP